MFRDYAVREFTEIYWKARARVRERGTQVEVRGFRLMGWNATEG